VAAYVKGLSTFGGVALPGTVGPEVRIIYYEHRDQYLDILKHTINALTLELDAIGVSGSNVTILAADNSFLPDCIYQPGFFACAVQEVTPCPDSTRVVATTVQKFKGLESTAIVLVGLQELEKEVARHLLYVGASRARSVLRIILPEKSSRYVQDRLCDILNALQDATDASVPSDDMHVL
jgi:hypothetical protein